MEDSVTRMSSCAGVGDLQPEPSPAAAIATQQHQDPTAANPPPPYPGNSTPRILRFTGPGDHGSPVRAGRTISMNADESEDVDVDVDVSPTSYAFPLRPTTQYLLNTGGASGAGDPRSVPLSIDSYTSRFLSISVPLSSSFFLSLPLSIPLRPACMHP